MRSVYNMHWKLKVNFTGEKCALYMGKNGINISYPGEKKTVLERQVHGKGVALYDIDNIRVL